MSPQGGCAHMMPLVRYWKPSYSLVVMERMLPSTICSTSSCSCSSVMFMWKRSFRLRMVLEPWKQGSCEPGGERRVMGGEPRRAPLRARGGDLLCAQPAGPCHRRGDGAGLREAGDQQDSPRAAPPLTLLHDLHDLHHFIHVLPCSDQPLQHQHLVVVEHVPVWAPHHLQGRTQ